jgi:hypothetical protein
MNHTLRFALLLLFVAACGGPATSPSPTPGGSPTIGPSASPSPTPTGPSPSGSPDQPSASPSPTFDGDAISHPTGADELVLQYETGGGLIPPDFLVTQMPSFSLYGDGTVIIVPTEERGRVMEPGTLPRLIKATMTEEQVQALLRFALGQGRLLEAREHYPQDTCADCGAATFRIHAAGVEKVVTVDALGMADGMRGDATDRRGFMALVETLTTFEQRMLAGELGEVSLYDPEAYLVALFEAQGAQGELLEWPWDDVTLDDFKSQGDITWRRDARLTREQVGVITEVPSGPRMGLFVEAEDGKIWSVALRPLLPDEIAEDGGDDADR